MDTICKRAKVKPFGFHAIRHLHASILFNEGTELSVVQRQLRHTNPNTTARYLRSLGYEAEHEQKVLAVMEGRSPAKALTFADTKKGSPDLVIRRAGTQSRYTEPGNLKATGA